MKQISVIIPSYCSSATLGRTLDSLSHQTRPDLLKEVIVVDSSDDEATARLLKDYADKVRLIHLPEKAIPAAGRNRGAREASAEILAFIDSDATAASDWLEKIAAAHGAGCRVGGGAILLPPEQRANDLALSQYFLQFSEFMGDGVRRQTRFAPSCNLFCEKRLFEAAGGFPNIRAAEDVLFGDAIAPRARFYFDPEIKVYHIFSNTWERYRTNQMLLGEYMLVARRRGKAGWMYPAPLAFLLAPFFAAGKFVKVASRVAKTSDPGLRQAFWSRQPCFLSGLSFLAWGFGKRGLSCGS